MTGSNTFAADSTILRIASGSKQLYVCLGPILGTSREVSIQDDPKQASRSPRAAVQGNAGGAGQQRQQSDV